MSSSIEKFPGELLEEILRDAIIIPDERFLAFRTASTFATFVPSTAPGILRVSRRWHQIGTPWLYESIILRTSAQVALVCRALAAFPLLATRIRRLRIEVGPSDSLNFIVWSAGPTIHTIYLAVDLPDDISHSAPYLSVGSEFSRALRRSNPSRLVLDGLDYRNRLNTIIRQTLSEVIPSWFNLVQVDLNYLSMALALALRGGPSVRQIFLRQNIMCKFIPILRALAGGSSLQVIHCHHMPNLNILEKISIRLLDIIQFGDATSVLKRTKMYALSCAAPDLPDEVWSRILAFAMHVHHPDYVDLSVDGFHQSVHEHINATRCSIVLVCRRFNRLGTPFLHAFPILANSKLVQCYLRLLQRQPQLARFIRAFPWTIGSMISLAFGDFFIKSTVISLVAPLTALVHATPYFRVFPQLAEEFAEGENSPLISADQLLLDGEEDVFISPSAFLPFSQLRSLELSCGCTSFDSGDVPHDALPALTTLKILSCGSSLGKLFIEMRLPSLREVEINGTQIDVVYRFLVQHGFALERLAACAMQYLDACPTNVLDLCPHLIELTILDAYLPPLGFIADAAPHTTLKRISLCSIGYRHFPVHELMQLCSRIVPHPLMALEEIATPLTYFLPRNEVELNDHHLRECARHMLEHGIAFVDRDGNRWTRV
ncbi:hypothetical protein BKA93DRAFT_829284 [Sparassis latifolia]